MNMEELKPCPFCGSSAIVDSSDGVSRFWVLCISDGCIACGPIRKTEEEAIEAWNNRTKSS